MAQSKLVSLPSGITIGSEELKAATRVIKSGVLSDFVGRAGQYFYGGREVKALEKSISKKFKTRFALSFNSATTALEAAVAALELPPGSEVIVSPYTMSATLTAIIVNNLVPIFADVEPETFCLDANSIAKNISKNTKAVIVTNLFGGPAKYQEILKVTRKHKLKIIEDNAQAPGAKYQNKFLGTVGDIGVFSFNFHKVIHSGEGGVLVTNNPRLAYAAALKRNHGENVLDDTGANDPLIIGTNSRMTEITAAIAAEQLKKLDALTNHRIKLANYLTVELNKIPGLYPTVLPKNSRHVYYVYPFRLVAKEFGLSRNEFIKKMESLGFVLHPAYQKPLYRLNIFKNKKLYHLYHWLNPKNYRVVNCPTVERLHREEMVYATICRYPVTQKQLADFVKALKQVYESSVRRGGPRGR